MKKTLLFVFIYVLILNLGASTNFQMKEYPFYGTVNFNLSRFSGDDAGSTLGLNPSLRLGYNYNPYFALEASGSWSRMKPSDKESSGLNAWTTASEDFETTTTIYNFDFGIHLNALPKAGTNPYLSVGIGQLSWSVENDAVDADPFDWGKTFNNNYAYIKVGVEAKMSDRISLKFDYKRNMIFGDTDNLLGDNKAPDVFTQAGVGFCYKFGRGVYEKVDLEAIEAVHFEFNSIRLTKESHRLVKQVAEAMNKNPDLVVEVRGFTDNTGSDSVNLRMSKKRAMTVKQMLVDMGIKSYRIITTAMGHQNPVATNSTPEGRAMNRRVEFYELEK